jgi:tetratricopeptide (TPR) repeat protein
MISTMTIEASPVEARVLHTPSRLWRTEAETAVWRAPAILLNDFERDSDSLESAKLYNQLAEAAEARGQYQSAQMNALRAWETMTRLGFRCRTIEAESIRTEALGRMGSALRGAGRYQEAEDWLRRAMQRAERYGQRLPTALNRLGVLYQCTGDFPEAERLYRQALGLATTDSDEAADAYRNLGALAHTRGCYAEGEANAHRAWQIRLQLHGPHHPETLADACDYAAILDGLGRFEESEPMYWSALHLLHRIFGGENPEIAGILHNLANVRKALNDPQGAEALYWLAVSMKEKLLGAGHPDTAWTMHSYASMLADSGRVEEAWDMEWRAMLVFEMAFTPSHPRRLAAQQLWQRLSA